MNFMTKTLLGIDMGGTKIEAALFQWNGNELIDAAPRERIPTNRDEGYEAIVSRMAAFVENYAEKCEVDLANVPIGVGMPGGLTRSGLIKNSNTVCLNGRPFRQDLMKAVGQEITFENDANCFALAEARLGAAKAHSSGVVFGVIMGTGCGGGVVLKGHVWGGLHGIGGEWGHHCVFPGRGPKCYCGQVGCMEQFVSGPAVERHYAELSGEKRKLAEIVTRRASDPHAAAAIDQLLEAFGRGLANVIDILDPSAIVLGGGVSNLDLLYTEGRQRVAAVVFNDELQTPILKHQLGDSAGVLGAAMLNVPT